MSSTCAPARLGSRPNDMRTLATRQPSVNNPARQCKTPVNRLVGNPGASSSAYPRTSSVLGAYFERWGHAAGSSMTTFLPVPETGTSLDPWCRTWKPVSEKTTGRSGLAGALRRPSGRAVLKCCLWNGRNTLECTFFDNQGSLFLSGKILISS